MTPRDEASLHRLEDKETTRLSSPFTMEEMNNAVQKMHTPEGCRIR